MQVLMIVAAFVNLLNTNIRHQDPVRWARLHPYRALVAKMAVSMEIADATNKNMTSPNLANFIIAMEGVSVDYQLLGDAPLCKNIPPFPNNKRLSQALELNRQLQIWLDNSPPSRERNDAICEVVRVRSIYDTVQIAINKNNPIVLRRAYLERLRYILGRDNYKNARLPSPIPLMLGR